MIVSIWRNLWCLSAEHPSFTFSLRYCKDIANLLFWVLWACLAMHTFVYLTVKKSTLSPMFSWRYCKCMQTSYFGYFGYVWLRKPKITVSTCRKLRCLPACQKKISSFTFSLGYYILKNPAIWLANNILTHNSRIRILPDMELVAKHQ